MKLPLFRIKPRHAASAVVIAASIYFSAVQLENDRLRQRRDLEFSASMLTRALKESAEPKLAAGRVDELERLAERFGTRGRLAGIAVYDAAGSLVSASNNLAPRLSGPPRLVSDCLRRGAEADGYEAVGGRTLRLNVVPLRGPRGLAGALAVFHDPGYIEFRMQQTRASGVRRLAFQGLLFLAILGVLSLLFR